jgi:hypothetical protein
MTRDATLDQDALLQRRREAQARLREASKAFTRAKAMASADPEAHYLARAALDEAKHARAELQRIAAEERERREGTTR